MGKRFFGHFWYINEQKLHYLAIVLFQMTFFLFSCDEFVINTSLDQLHHKELEVICRYKSIFYIWGNDFWSFLVYKRAKVVLSSNCFVPNDFCSIQ